MRTLLLARGISLLVAPTHRPGAAAMRTLLLALGLSLLVAPTAAAATYEWQPDVSGVPSTVDLEAVTVGGGTPIAVGWEPTTGLAVILRRGEDGMWGRESVVAPPTEVPPADPADEPEPLRGRLVAVAAAGEEAWAVGETTDPEPEPLVLLSTPEGWEQVAAPDAMGLPRAVALSSNGGVIGDDAGNVFAIDAGTISAQPLPRGGALPPDPAPINGLALTAEGQGVAVARPSGAGEGFLSLQSGEVRRAGAEPLPAGVEPVAVAAAGSLRVAAEGAGPCAASTAMQAAPRLWSLDAATGLWRREAVADSTTADSRFCALALIAGDAPTLLVAGERAGHAAIWRRDGGGRLGRRDLPGPPLRGIAAPAAPAATPALSVAAGAVAVGEQGAVWRYAEVPPPPTPPEDPAPSEDDDEEQEPAADPAPATKPSPPAEEQRLDVPLAPPAPAQTAPTPAATPPAAKPRLLTGLKVRRRGRKLVLRFDLSTRARVLVTAVRGGRVVGRATSAPLPAGRGRLVLRFRGPKPPERLKIVVRPTQEAGK